MKILQNAALAAAACLVLLYAGDYASVRFRIPKSREPLGTVLVQPYYAVPLKDGKTELMFLKPENQTCVNSIFPHLGYSPCWYVRRHRDQRTDI
jgi:hypothetical protein